MGDHTETLQIDYDPAQLDFETIMHKFWRGHNPAAQKWKRQYMSAVFYHNETQRTIAIATRDQYAAEIKREIHTEIAPAGHFYLAEDYHQKFKLQQQRQMMAEFEKIYPNFNDLINSTAVARVNGHLSGYGQAADLDQYGLSTAAQARIREYLRR